MTLTELQKILIKNDTDAYIVTRNNMFLGQDVLNEENKVKELTGFSGSAGNLIVFRDKAVLFVDGRYELQAAMEVDPAAVSVVTTRDTLATWMQNNLDSPCKIFYNPWCHSISEIDYWNRALKKHTFIANDKDLLGSRLSARKPEIFELGIEFSGVSMEEKISYLTEFMTKKSLDAFFISECDSLSWLTNLRSDCLPDTPILRAFAVVDRGGEISLFTSDFKQIEVELAQYKGRSIGLSFKQTPRQIYNIMKDHRIWMENTENPINAWKAVKNPVELNGFQKAHHRDGLSVIRFLHWLENNWQGQDELSIVGKLHHFRARNQHFYGNSFETIAGFASNGAIVHYHPENATNKQLEAGSLLLLDSGAQYYDATTDITRTVAIGKPSTEMIDSFTQVLKAHIAVASAYFPVGTAGSALDALSRAQLWQYGKDYNHGTGHGVGTFSNVHEGPNSISTKGNAPFAAHMISSIEPGYYKENAYGIRIENLAYTEMVSNPDFSKEMLCFKILTLVPIDKHLINKYLLNQQELDWLNNYHAQILQELRPDLEPEVADWLEQACSPL